MSFFAFDFYTAEDSQMLETAFDDGLLKSKYISKFKFCGRCCVPVPAGRMPRKRESGTWMCRTNKANY